MTPLTPSTRPSLVRLAGGLALAAALGCPSPRVDRPGTPPTKSRSDMTSAELVAAGETDTVFVRRVRMFEQIAETISTDSLARLYTAAMGAPAERGSVYQQAIQCQFGRMIKGYGAIATKLAINRMEDSLLVTPERRKQWSETQRRWPKFSEAATCDMSDVARAPDSLNNQPRKAVWP